MKKIKNLLMCLLSFTVMLVSVNISSAAPKTITPKVTDEVVRFIVTLSGDCVVDAMEDPAEVEEYLTTDEGEETLDMVEEFQRTVVKKIKKQIPDVKFIEEFSVAINAVVVETKRSNLQALKKIAGVETVRESQKVTLMDNVTNPGMPFYSGSMMQSETAADMGYKGEGMVIAVIDSALDIDHEAFDRMPSLETLKKEDVQSAVESGLLNAQAATDDLYINAKIPFVYDYEGNDTDVTAPPANSHGTHVSGLAVGNCDSFQGVAPEAQLVFMKLSSDDSSIVEDFFILAALEDCAILGVDVANLSIGFSAGFTDCGEYETVFDNCTRVGTSVVCSAGNDADQAINMNNLGTGAPLAAEPDASLISSPSTSRYAMSVASAERIRDLKELYLKAGDEKIKFSDSNAGTAKAFETFFHDQTLEYIVVPGMGRTEDFAGLDLTGKVALIWRGEISFSEKEANAIAAGAVGVIICNTSDELQLTASTNAVPIIMITKTSAQFLTERAEKTIFVSEDNYDMIPYEQGGLMSSYSSIGVAPDMTLKPEITAPGGGAYSSLPDDNYGMMSGTSMATPQISGAIAVIKQYYQDYLNTKPVENHSDIIHAIMMNTAQLVEDPDGVPYTPRKQGSGLAQVANAIQADAYITVQDNHRSVAQLGSSKEGIFSTRVTIHNLSGVEKVYTPSAISLVPKLEAIQGVAGITFDCMSLYSRILSEQEFQVEFSRDRIVIPAGESATVDISMQLTSKGREGVAGFINGIYMDGYLMFEDEKQDGIDLHVPYLGFYGDWNALGIFDKTIYDSEYASVFASYVAMLDASQNGFYLGANEYTPNFDVDINKIAFNEATMENGYVPTIVLGTLRGIRTIDFEVFDEEGRAIELFDVYSLESAGMKMTYEYQPKTIKNAADNRLYFFSQTWAPAKQDGEELVYLDDGVYTARFTAMPEGTENPAYAQVQEFTMTIDNEIPTFIDYEVYEENGSTFLKIYASDNHYLKVASLIDDGESVPYSEPMAVSENEKGAVSELVFDVTQLLADQINVVKVEINDYARNNYISEPIDISTTRLLPTTVSLVKDSFETQGETTIQLEAYVDPKHAVSELQWECDNEEVATIISTGTTRVDAETGVIYHVAEVSVKDVDGTANITVKTQNGKAATAVIKATKQVEEAVLEEPIVQEEPKKEKPAKMPGTGDDSRVGFWLALLCGMGIIIGVIRRRSLR